jgi:hypothetical protein
MKSAWDGPPKLRVTNYNLLYRLAFERGLYPLFGYFNFG